VVPYYLSLINPDDPDDPVRLQSIPTAKEYYDQCGAMDPMAEEFSSPAPAITRRYPDRLIINVTNQCATYCRHCQRRRNIGELDKHTPRKDLEAAIQYIAQNEEIRDVLLTGGDALMLSVKTLDWILTELDKIPHVEIKRLGSRVPVSLPYRVTDELCEMLSSHLPLYLNTHFNHPMEVTPDARAACLKLTKSGIILGNQAVLLKGINNHPLLMKKLNHELLKIMVLPYLIFHAKGVRGTSHFRTRVEDGIEIMEKLRGYTSGLAIPTYIINAPNGYGKTPMFPEYLVSMGRNKLLIRTWEKRVLEYENDEEV
jgi:glutamate 2,3-aminomutase